MRNRRGGMRRACFALLYRSVSSSRTPAKHPRVPQGILGIPQTAGNRWRGGGGVGVGHKGQGACCTLQSPPLFPAYFFLVLWVPQRSHRQPEIGGEPGLWGWVVKGRASCALQSPPLLPAYFWGFPDPIGSRQPENARNRRRGRGFGVGHKGQGLLRATVPLIFGAFPVPGSHRQPENILTVAQHVHGKADRASCTL